MHKRVPSKVGAYVLGLDHFCGFLIMIHVFQGSFECLGWRRLRRHNSCADMGVVWGPSFRSVWKLVMLYFGIKYGKHAWRARNFHFGYTGSSLQLYEVSKFRYNTRGKLLKSGSFQGFLQSNTAPPLENILKIDCQVNSGKVHFPFSGLDILLLDNLVKNIADELAAVSTESQF